MKFLKRESHPNWKGGRIFRKDYKYILRPHHSNCDNRGYVLEHRYLVELDLGRYLTKEEVVHHIDKNKQNNLKNNLQLMTHSEHSRLTNTKTDLPNYICYICKTDKTTFKKSGRPRWYKYQNDKKICDKCRCKLYYRNRIM